MFKDSFVKFYSEDASLAVTVIGHLIETVISSLILSTQLYLMFYLDIVWKLYCENSTIFATYYL